MVIDEWPDDRFGSSIFKTNEQLNMEAEEARKLILSTNPINMGKLPTILEQVYDTLNTSYKCPGDIVYCRSPFEMMKRTSHLTRRSDNNQYQSNSPAYRVLGDPTRERQRTYGLGEDLASLMFNNLESNFAKFVVTPDYSRFVRRISIFGNWSASNARGSLNNLNYMERARFNDVVKLRGLYAKYGGMASIHHKHAFFCERPNLIQMRNNQVHCEDGPALRWPDGYVIYVWKGIPVAPNWIEDEKLNPKFFMKIRNAEQRRAYLEIYAHKFGTEAVLKDLRATVITRDEAFGRPRTILEFGGASYVHVQNGTLEADNSRREFLLRVGSHLSVNNAIAWGYGLNEHDYKEAVRT